MPYKDKEARKEAARLSMQKKRKGLKRGVVNPKDVNPSEPRGLTSERTFTDEYHPVMYALIDKDKRAKLQSIVEHLADKKLLGRVYYGIGQNSIDFTRVSQLLDATQ